MIIPQVTEQVDQKKRKFYGNQNKDEEGNQECPGREDRSARFKNLEKIPLKTSTSYRIIDFLSVFNFLSTVLICATCKSKVS